MTLLLSTAKITFIGAGSMAEAILRGLIERNATLPEQLYVMNRSNVQRLDELKQRYLVHTVSLASASTPPEASANADLQKKSFVQQADVVVLCMKPKDTLSALNELCSWLQPHQCIISVVAGLSIQTIASFFPHPMPIVRTMPNTSSAIGLGATGVSFGSHTSDAHKQLATAMCEAIGTVTIVEEHLLDVVTGLSGSGPAYVYYFMEAMIQAGIDGGLTAEQARQLTVQTFLGASHMVHQTNEEPDMLRKKVTSPNGTTQAAIALMEQQQVAQSIMQAVFASVHRSKEMGQQLSDMQIK